MTVVYANRPETVLRKSYRKSSKATNHVLMGTWLEVLGEKGAWFRVAPRSNRGKGGWVKKSHTRDTPVLKVFVVDVGQGDGAIIEAPNGTLLIDGGPSKKFYNFLKSRYRPIMDEGKKVHFDALVVSHPDTDHYRGLIHALNDKRFTFGTIYHNGIIRYECDSNSGKGFDLGRLEGKGQILAETFNDLGEAIKLVQGGELMATFKQFWVAANNAKKQGRLKNVKCITNRLHSLPGFDAEGKDKLKINILGPVPTSRTGAVKYVTFSNPHNRKKNKASSSHTRNGHSLVLKLIYGQHSFLFGGDLNIPAEKHLMDYYKDYNPFNVTVAKSCHHGSSDFSVDYLKRVLPHVNVVSSGDNKSYDHPMADAIGAATHWTQGDIPLFFSTELARAYSKQQIHYGLINFRSNVEVLTAAQMKEQHKNKSDVWDSYTVPWHGKFNEGNN